MDASQAWIWILMSLFLDILNSTPTQSLDITAWAQDPRNLGSMVNHTLEKTESPLKSDPTATRLLTTAPISNTLEATTKGTDSEYLQQSSNIDELKVYGDTATPKSSKDLKIIGLNNRSLGPAEGKKSNVGNMQIDTKEGFNKLQAKLPLSEKDSDDVQKKQKSVFDDHKKANETSGSNDIQTKKAPVSGVHLKPPKFSTKYSKTPLLREGINDSQKQKDTGLDIKVKPLENSTNSSSTHLSRESTGDIQKKKDIASNIQKKAIDTDDNEKQHIVPDVQGKTPGNSKNPSKTQDKIPLARSKISRRPEDIVSEFQKWQKERQEQLFNVPKFDLPSSGSSDMIMDTKIEQPATYETALLVRISASQVDLKNSTEIYMRKFNHIYAQLPRAEADNSNWHRYSRAIVERFVLDFCRLYVQKFLSDSEDEIDYRFDLGTNHKATDYTDKELDLQTDYNETYSLALSHLREKKWQTAQQLAVPVINTADAFKAALDVPVGIVRSKCKAYMRPWQCYVHYLSNLIDEAEICANVWHQADLHLKVLQITNPANTPTEIIIKELGARKKSMSNRKASRLFNFVVRTIKRLRNRLADSLIVQANLYHELKYLQANGLLGCYKMEQVYSELNFIG